MNIVGSAATFTFNYGVYDQSSTFVRANIYEVSTGTPALVSQVTLTSLGNGYYAGNYLSVAAKAYLVVCVCYTDGTYTVIDSTRPPTGDIYKTADADEFFVGFSYTAWDMATGLFVRAGVYDGSTGSFLFQSNVVMNHIFAGCYFGAYTGTDGGAYEFVQLVYTDGTYATVDTSRAPGTESIGVFQGGTGTVYTFKAATLIGQSTGPRQLSGQLLVAKLKAGPCS